MSIAGAAWFTLECLLYEILLLTLIDISNGTFKHLIKIEDFPYGLLTIYHTSEGSTPLVMCYTAIYIPQKKETTMSFQRMPHSDDFPPIIMQPSKTSTIIHGEVYDVEAIQRYILDNPGSFKIDTILTNRLKPQLDSRSDLRKSNIDSVSDEHARRPLIMILYKDGSGHLVNGYHRASKALKLKIDMVGVYVLSYKQSQMYTLQGTRLAQALNGKII